MPILFIDVPELHDENPVDQLIASAQEAQWEDWRDLRWEEVSSGSYRRAVNRLALSLSTRVDEAEHIDIVPTLQELDYAEKDGMLDRLAALEQAMPDWALTLDNLRNEIANIGALATVAAERMNAATARGKGFAARLTVARRFAGDLAGPVENVATLGAQFADQLRVIDEGVREIVGLRIYATTEEDIQGFDEFARVLRELSLSAREGLGSVEALVRDIEPVENMSKDVRPPLRRLRGALTSLADARAITDSWVTLVESRGSAEEA